LALMGYWAGIFASECEPVSCMRFASVNSHRRGLVRAALSDP